MALSLPANVPQRDLLQEITFGVVLFTLLFQGTTIGRVVDRALRVDPASATLESDLEPDPAGAGSSGSNP
jgi:NhaP-type Na+/H+ or K+/H+ antiporter